MQNPRRGELYWVDFSPGRGSEQTGVRPGLIIQNDVGNEHAPTTIVAVISTTMRAMPIHVTVEPSDVNKYAGDTGLRAASQVKLEQIQTIAKERLRQRIGTLSEAKLRQVDVAVRISLAV